MISPGSADFRLRGSKRARSSWPRASRRSPPAVACRSSPTPALPKPLVQTLPDARRARHSRATCATSSTTRRAGAWSGRSRSGDGHTHLMQRRVQGHLRPGAGVQGPGRGARARPDLQGHLRAAHRAVFVRHRARDRRALLRRHHSLSHQPLHAHGREGGQPHAHGLRQRAGERHVERQAAGAGKPRRHARCGGEIPRAVPGTARRPAAREERSGRRGARRSATADAGGIETVPIEETTVDVAPAVPPPVPAPGAPPASTPPATAAPAPKAS